MPFPIHFKEKVVRKYFSKKQKGKKISYKKIGQRFGIPPTTIHHWVERYAGTMESLLPRSSPGRPRKLSQKFVLDNLVPTVVKHNIYHQHIDLSKLIAIHRLDIDRRTVNNYTLEAGITSKCTRMCKLSNDPATIQDHDVLASFRQETQKFKRKNIYVFDEKKFLSNSIPRKGLSLKGTENFQLFFSLFSIFFLNQHEADFTGWRFQGEYFDF